MLISARYTEHDKTYHIKGREEGLDRDGLERYLCLVGREDDVSWSAICQELQDHGEIGHIPGVVCNGCYNPAKNVGEWVCPKCGSSHTCYTEWGEYDIVEWNRATQTVTVTLKEERDERANSGSFACRSCKWSWARPALTVRKGNWANSDRDSGGRAI